MKIFSRSNKDKDNNHTFIRSIAAIFGGYILANQVSILLISVLPGDLVDRVMLGLLLSFVTYTVIALWVFSVSRLRILFSGILIPIFVFTFLIMFMPDGS